METYISELWKECKLGFLKLSINQIHTSIQLFLSLLKFFVISSSHIHKYPSSRVWGFILNKKSFYQDDDLKPTEDLLFSITLIPLATYEAGIKR